MIISDKKLKKNHIGLYKRSVQLYLNLFLDPFYLSRSLVLMIKVWPVSVNIQTKPHQVNSYGSLILLYDVYSHAEL